jgi:cytochrome c-type biogenesis protein CcmH/NrfF
MRRLAIATLVVVVLTIASPAAAAACPRTSLGAIESEVMCLQCGVPLDVAENSPDANRERAYIQQLVAQCKSKSEIKAALVSQYGDRVLAAPKAKGFGLAAYVVPIGGFLVALGVVTLAALRWRRRRARPTAPAPAPAGDAARLESDLGRYDL